jgi:hypothetical protein
VRRLRLIGSRRRRGIPVIALVGAAAIGFAAAHSLIVPDGPSGESAQIDSRVLERSALTSGATEPSGGDCDIKGNISVTTGERIYHLPGQRYYDETQISRGKGERYFCSEAEARAAGWRRAKV